VDLNGGCREKFLSSSIKLPSLSVMVLPGNIKAPLPKVIVLDNIINYKETALIQK
jgi:hypothetical protein